MLRPLMCESRKTMIISIILLVLLGFYLYKTKAQYPGWTDLMLSALPELLPEERPIEPTEEDIEKIRKYGSTSLQEMYGVWEA